MRSRACPRSTAHRVWGCRWTKRQTPHWIWPIVIQRHSKSTSTLHLHTNGTMLPCALYTEDIARLRNHYQIMTAVLDHRPFCRNALAYFSSPGLPPELSSRPRCLTWEDSSSLLIEDWNAASACQHVRNPVTPAAAPAFCFSRCSSLGDVSLRLCPMLGFPS